MNALKDLNAALKTISPDTMKAFIAEQGEGSFFYCKTVGPQDCLYLPPAWTFGEEVAKGKDVSGLKLCILAHSHLAELDELNSHLIAMQQEPSGSLQRAVDF